jgi:hypothetical protein
MCQKNIRAAHDNYMRDIISPDAAKNPKKFWSFIKGKKQESSGMAPLRQTDGTLHSNPHTTADILSLCNLAGMESGPVALYGLMFFSNFSTPGMVTIIGSMVLCGLSPLSGIELISSLVKTDLN